MGIPTELIANQFVSTITAAIAGALFTWISTRVHKISKKQQAQDEAFIALLGSEIESIYEDCKRTGEWTLEALKRVHRLNEPYRRLGGNGTIKRIVQHMETKCTE